MLFYCSSRPGDIDENSHDVFWHVSPSTVILLCRIPFLFWEILKYRLLPDENTNLKNSWESATLQGKKKSEIFTKHCRILHNMQLFSILKHHINNNNSKTTRNKNSLLKLCRLRPKQSKRQWKYTSLYTLYHILNCTRTKPDHNALEGKSSAIKGLHPQMRLTELLTSGCYN